MQRSGIVDSPSINSAQVKTSNDRPRNRRLRALGVGLALTIVALIAVPLLYGLAHNGHVFQGVRVLGTNLGGMSRSEAQAAISEAAKQYAHPAVLVSGNGHEWTLSADDLGIAVDTGKTLDAALTIGRGGDLLGNVGMQTGALFGGHVVAPLLKSDPALVDKAVARIASDVDKPALNSALRQNSDGTFSVTPASNGTVLDRAVLVASLAAAPVEVVALVMKEDRPTLIESDLQAAATRIEQLTSLPVILSAGEESWTIEPPDLRSMVDLSSANAGDGEREVTLNDSNLTLFLNGVAEEARVEPRDAEIVISKSKVALKEEQDGSEVDMPAALSMVKAAFATTDLAAREVALPMKKVAAAVHAADIRPVYEKANALVTQGIRMRFRDDGYILRNDAVTAFLSVEQTEDGPGFELAIDEEILANRISGLGYYINRNASDARFRMVNGRPTRVAEAREGFKVNVEGSLPIALKAIDSYRGTEAERLQVDLDVAITEPATKDADLSTVNTPDLLGSGQTSYAGSSAERAWNVGLGTRNVDGALIPPGGVFSTVDTIGDLTLEAGFKMGYAIVRTSRGLTTVPAEAGGICQVATTLFHSVFWAGLPVVERNWHSYWIATYGRAPGGMQGLDATIAPPEKDFRFKNNTGHWILIKATADGKTVNFQLYGVNPGWKVNVSGPVITNPVKTSTAPVTEYSSQLPSGKKVLVEHAQDGFSASITRTVTDSSGNVIDKWTAKSRYAPARNRYLIGTGN